MDLRDAIQRIALEWPSYGRPRITAELRRRGWTVNPKRVYRLLREDNLLCVLFNDIWLQSAIGYPQKLFKTQQFPKKTMRPKCEPRPPQRELFQIDLEQLINPQHPRAVLVQKINRGQFDLLLGSSYHPTQGAPGTPTRVMVALHFLKYQTDLSDEEVVSARVENPYGQHFSGMRYFQHAMPIDPSSITRWRKRLGEAGAEQMLRETIEVGMRMNAIRPAELQRLKVDTTVQTKAIRFPTDARLYHRMRERLVKEARAEGLQIKQSYQHVGKCLLMQSSRYAHARQRKRARACTRQLKTQLGRATRYRPPDSKTIAQVIAAAGYGGSHSWPAEA